MYKNLTIKSINFLFETLRALGTTLGHSINKRASETYVPFGNVANYITFDTLNYSWIVFLVAAGGITYVRD